MRERNEPAIDRLLGQCVNPQSFVEASFKTLTAVRVNFSPHNGFQHRAIRTA
jgi:hypothetical protein